MRASGRPAGRGSLDGAFDAEPAQTRSPRVAARQPIEQLRQLSREKLVAGRKLPGPIHDRTGLVVAQKGELLTPQRLGELRAVVGGLFVDPEWDAAQRAQEAAHEGIAPDELLEALKRRQRPRGAEPPGRRNARFEWCVQTQVVLREIEQGHRECRAIQVETCDVSSGGFGFLCQQFVNPGTVVYVRFKKLPHEPVMKGVVRHCILIEGRRHRVGVQFLPLEPGEKVPHGTA